MGWFRKVVYAGLGARMAGPIGALFGFGIACVQDICEKTAEETSPFSTSFPKGKPRPKQAGAPKGRRPVMGAQAADRRAVFLICFLSALAKIAKVDGVVSAREIQCIQATLKKLHLDAKDTEMAQNVFRKAKDDVRYEFTDYLRQFVDTVHDQTLNDLMFRAIVEVACADGDLLPAEALLLRKAERILLQPLGMGDRIIREMLQNDGSRRHTYQTREEEPHLRKRPPKVDDYAVLGLSSTASDDEVRRAWRKKCMELHPDRIQAKGLPQEFIRFANEQLAEVNGAYSRIAKIRGIK